MIEQPETFDQQEFDRTIREWEIGWMNGSDDFAVEPAGDPVAVSKQMYSKYTPVVEQFWSL